MATTQTRTAAPESNSSRDLYLFLLLIFLALGVGGVAGALTLWPEASLSKLVSYFIVAFSTLGATALSGFVIFSLHGTKAKTADLLRDIETDTHELSNEAEKIVGSSRVLSNLGITGSSLALASNGVMLIMTVLRTYSEDSKWLPVAWVLTNAALNSATNLYGFAANMVVS
ncbi:MAG TPA: hypothetical protein VD770_01790, partial [Coxiellaceae bacterium]|nr:hypothetical protein [Coxiellaceae bacterium]